jgi:Tfp pilus assembly protein PilO
MAAGAALLLAVIWYMALFRPQSHHLSTAHAARAAAEAQVQSLNGQVAHLKALEKQIPQDTATLAVLKAAVPDTPDLPDALGQLHNAATSSGVQLSGVSPSSPPTSASAGGQQHSGPPSINLSMTASGNYQQLTNFMTRLDGMARTVVIDTVSIGASTTSTLTANFSAQIFYAGSSTP